VGERPRDLPPPRMTGTKFHMQWTPIMMTSPDGGNYEFHWYFIDMGDERRHFTAHLNHPDGSQERIVDITPDIAYDPRNRDLLGGQMALTTASGVKRTIDIEPLSPTGFRLHPALYSKWNDAHHGTWRGPLHVEGEQIENCDEHLDGRVMAMWQLRDRPVRVREGESSGFGIVESICAGDYPQFGVPG